MKVPVVTLDTVTVQFAVVAVRPAKVQGEPVTVGVAPSAASVVKPTVPAGVVWPAIAVSVTVAVHVVALAAATEVGEQATAVEVGCDVTATAADVSWLPEWKSLGV